MICTVSDRSADGKQRYTVDRRWNWRGNTFETAMFNEFKTLARSSSCEVGVAVPINQPFSPIKGDIPLSLTFKAANSAFVGVIGTTPSPSAFLVSLLFRCNNLNKGFTEGGEGEVCCSSRLRRTNASSFLSRASFAACFPSLCFL